ncbi:MAG: hypothetical protein R3F61_01615 [Myxococcota bacterium]
MTRLLAMGGLILALAACGVNRGPGITGAWFTYSTRVMDTPVHFDDSQTVPAGPPDSPFDATLIGIAPGGLPLFRDSAGIWLTDTGLSDPVLLGDASQVFSGKEHVILVRDSAALERTVDGTTYEPVLLPDGLEVVTDLRADSHGTLYAAGTFETPSDLSRRWGAVYVSEDDGRSWDVVIDTLFNPPGDALNGRAESVRLRGVGGFYDLEICALGTCTYLRGNPDDWVTYLEASAVPYGSPMPIGFDGDGRILATAGFDRARGITTPEIVVLDPEDHAADPAVLDHFHTGFAPVPLEYIDHEGYGWGTAFDLDGYGIFRTVEPLGASHDQRSAVLAGPGCSRYYTYDPDYGYAGDGRSIEIHNGSTETLGLFKVLSLSPQQAYPDGGIARVAPGDTFTFDTEEEDWLMALTTDGRCKGYGMAKKLDGKTL